MCVLNRMRLWIKKYICCCLCKDKTVFSYDDYERENNIYVNNNPYQHYRTDWWG